MQFGATIQNSIAPTCSINVRPVTSSKNSVVSVRKALPATQQFSQQIRSLCVSARTRSPRRRVAITQPQPRRMPRQHGPLGDVRPYRHHQTPRYNRCLHAFVSGFKLLSTYHPAAVIRQPSIRRQPLPTLAKSPLNACRPQSIALPVKFGSNQPSLTLRNSMSNESADVTFFRLTLKRLGIKSLASDSHLRRNLLSSFRSMTSDKQTEIIGEMLETSETLGNCASNSYRSINPEAVSKRTLRHRLPAPQRRNSSTWGHARHDATASCPATRVAERPGLSWLLYSNHGPWKSERRIATIKRDE